jgi:GNAT superfamily N-acetyltransferase
LVFFWSNEFSGDIIEIDEMVVDEKYRGLGIGKAFFLWLDSTFCGCRGFALQTSLKNEMARRLYESVGFVASRNRYFIKLRT